MDFGWCPILQYKKTKSDKKKEKRGETSDIALIVGMPVSDSANLDNMESLQYLQPVPVNAAKDILVSLRIEMKIFEFFFIFAAIF